jgi:streptomycin 6-kinase
VGELVIPERLAAAVVAEEGDAARAWLRRLPALVAELVDAWALEVGAPYEGGHVAWVAPARRRSDGAELVLKVQVPSPESAPEALALRAWAGAGAVRLHEHDPERRGLLIERCDPGTAMGGEPDPVAALDEGLRLARTLHQVAVPEGVPSHADLAAAWADRVAGRRSLVPEVSPAAWSFALDVLRSGEAGARTVLLHGDLNPTNVLRSRRGWLAIDPKPMVGGAAVDAARLVLQLALEGGEDPTTAMGRRCERAGSVLGVAPAVVARWCVADLVGLSTWLITTGQAEDGHRRLTALEWLLPHAR